MRKVYKKILSIFSSIPAEIELFKTYLSEWIAILKKYKIYKSIKWTKHQKEEFSSFWKTHYGKKISCRWHKLYESINGVFDVRYLPEIFYSTKIEPVFNQYSYCKVLSDKSLTEVLFNNKIHNVRCPKTYLVSSGKYYYNANRETVSFESALNIINDIGECIIKPTVDTSSGKNVKFLNVINGIDENTGIPLVNILKNYEKNYIIQERINQHYTLMNIYPKSVNTIRVISYIINGEILCAPSSLRVGAHGSITDNIHAGGLNVGISESGLLNKKAFQLGYGDKATTYISHPNTGFVFENHELPYFKDIKVAAKKLHTLNPGIGMISWDFTVNNNNEIILIEANYTGQSVWFPQIVNEKSFFGENTELFLNLLSKKKRRKNE